MPRYSRSPNPTATNNVTGWLGSGTRSRITGLSGIPRTTGGRVSVTSSSFSASLSCAPAVASAGQVWTAVGYFRTSVARTVRYYLACWNNGTFVTTTSANDVSAGANTWYGFRLTGLTLPSGTYNQVSFHLDIPTSAASSGTLDLSSCRLEQINDGTLLYNDGDSGSPWSWDGDAGNSTSTAADDESATAADTGAGADAVTSVGEAGAVADTGSGTDTASVTDETPENVTVADTASGTDTAGVADAVQDTGDGVDDATIAEQGSVADTATGSDTAVVADGELLLVADTAAGLDELTVLDVPFTRVLEFRPGPTYEVVLVAVVFQAAGPPTLIEVDPIEWSSIKYSNELSKPQTLDVTCLIDSVPETILQRLRAPHELPTELHLLRDGRKVFTGPLRGGRPGAKTLTLVAHGVLSYLQEMYVTADQVFSQVDQFGIVAALVDQWQAQEYGNFGVDTSGVGVSGQLRDATYLRDELHEVGQRVAELGGRRNGFDLEVDPVTRRLQLWNPLKGVDRSTGEDAVVFDERNITSSGVMFSVAAGDVASEAFGTGTSTGGAGNLYSAQVNLELRARYGRRGVTGTWSSVSEQPTLDAHVQGLLDARAETLWVPSPNLRVTPDADLSAYAVGDWVAFEVHERLGVSGAFRIRRQDITVSSTGVEDVTVAFV